MGQSKLTVIYSTIYIFLFIFLFHIGLNEAQRNDTAEINQVGIWNGEIVTHDYHHNAQIFRRGVFHCTGFVAKINNDKTAVIMSAAHCITDVQLFWKTYTVYLGSYEIGTGQVFEVQKMRRQPGFVKDVDGKDVGIIVTKDKIDFDLDQFPVEAAQIADRPFDPMYECTSAGYGYYKSPEVDTSVLRKATFTLLKEKDCVKNFPAKVIDQICASNIYRNGAEGDSGAPLLCDNLVFGVLSLVTSRPRFNRATVFQRLDDPETREFLIEEGLLPGNATKYSPT